MEHAPTLPMTAVLEKDPPHPLLAILDALIGLCYAVLYGLYVFLHEAAGAL
jgi:hypothetical protein